MRIMALVGDRIGDPLHTNREKIEISQVFIEILGFKGLLILLGTNGCSPVVTREFLHHSAETKHSPPQHLPWKTAA